MRLQWGLALDAEGFAANRGDKVYEAATGTDVTSAIESTLSRVTEGSVRVVSPHSVLTYLQQYPDVAPLTLRAVDLARRELGPDVALSLEVYSDPEIRDQHLVLYARQKQYDPAFRQGLRRIAEELSPCLEAVSGWLLVATDYRDPALT